MTNKKQLKVAPVWSLHQIASDLEDSLAVARADSQMAIASVGSRHQWRMNILLHYTCKCQRSRTDTDKYKWLNNCIANVFFCFSRLTFYGWIVLLSCYYDDSIFARPYSCGQQPLQPLFGGNDPRWGFAIFNGLSDPDEKVLRQTDTNTKTQIIIKQTNKHRQKGFAIFNGLSDPDEKGLRQTDTNINTRKHRHEQKHRHKDVLQSSPDSQI